MTVYRRNPLLMTVMGANPGPRRKRPADDPIDHAIGQAWHRLMSGIQVSVMDIPRIFRDVKLEMAAGMPLEEAVMRVGARFQVNRNPSLAASLAGGLAGAFVTHAMSNPGPDGFYVWGRSQSVGWYATRGEAERVAQQLNYRGGTHYTVRPAGRIAMRSNPGPSFVVIDSQTGRVAYTKRATGVGSAAIKACADKARKLADKFGHSFIVFLDIRGLRVGHQVNVGMVRVMGITEEVWPTTRRNPLTEAEHRQIMSQAIHDRSVADRYAERGEKFMSGQYAGRAARGREIAHNFSPKSNPGPKAGRRKITMTIEQFAKWVKAKRDPAMWKAFLAKFKGYEKWTHGSRSRKVTVEWQNVPGVDGLWITYDGGKQPESTYIMPKGSKRKGAWKHPWDTMPDIKHDPEAGVVLTKLRGRSKITDFYHR